jgi:DNA-binding MarR family transcriptional regulator
MVIMVEIGGVTTYEAGVLQAQANRALRVIMNRILKKHGLSMMQWSVLGFVYSANGSGVRISDLAKTLDTTQTFITNTVNNLEDKGFVKRHAHGSDSRSKIVMVEPKHVKDIEQIEKDVRKELKDALEGKINNEELATYLTVLTKFAQILKS